MDEAGIFSLAFIHSAVYGKFYNMQFLATLTSAAVNTLIHVFRYLHTCVHTHTFLLGMFLRVESLHRQIWAWSDMGFGRYCYRFLKVVVIVYAFCSNIWIWLYI